MHQTPRKSTPRVTNGTVRKKNDYALSTDYYDAPLPRMVVVDRKRPGEGYRHVLNKSDIYRFLEILPDWKRLAVGLIAVVLAPGEDGLDGYHSPGVVHVCAWPADRWCVFDRDYYRAHRDIFARLGVPCEETPEGDFLCQFDERAVRDYQLLHILLHELGHHHDRMTTRSQRRAGRGEAFAEAYAREHEAAIWEAYQRAFAR